MKNITLQETLDNKGTRDTDLTIDNAECKPRERTALLVDEKGKQVNDNKDVNCTDIDVNTICNLFNITELQLYVPILNKEQPESYLVKNAEEMVDVEIKRDKSNISGEMYLTGLMEISNTNVEIESLGNISTFDDIHANNIHNVLSVSDHVIDEAFENEIAFPEDNLSAIEPQISIELSDITDHSSEAEKMLFSYKLGHLNVNGWTKQNEALRQNIIILSNADFVSVNETHLKGNEIISVPGYRWIGSNRTMQHVKATRNFGGIGLLVKNKIAEEFTIEIKDKSFEGFMSVMFKHKTTGFSMIIGVCYLPPESSRWGRDSTAFFAHIIGELYKYDDVDNHVLLGDLNARIGKGKDYIEDIDELPKRKVLDENTNKHGSSLLEFLHESRMCVLNGRDKLDDYTSVSVKGASVVDYIMVPVTQFSSFSEFKVDSCLNMIEKHNLQQLVDVKSKPPDHALLTCMISILSHTALPEHENIVADHIPGTPEKFKVNHIPDNFLSSQVAINGLNAIENKLTLSKDTQLELDNIYSDFCNVIIDEMRRTLVKVTPPETIKRRYKPKKPFWCEDLTRLFEKSVECERKMKKAKFRNIKRIYRLEYKNARTRFDREYRKLKRQYQAGRMEELELVCDTNPKMFWEKIKQMGPKKKQTIPLEIYGDGKTIICNKEQVLEHWKAEFYKLYNSSENTNTNNPDDGIIKRMIDDSLYLQELRMNDPLFEANLILEKNFTVEEVKKAVYKTKLRKAVGCDTLPNEVLKNDKVVKILCILFQYCFDNSILPTDWGRAIIKPIPKSNENDPRIPMNYRGISLLSCVSKIFTSIINERMNCYFESQSTICDEQNGFRKERSCTDHVFALNSIVSLRQKEGLSTFAIFIDFSKAFDGINRKMLLYKILHTGIEGKMYYIAKALYNVTESCVDINGNRTDWFSTELGVRQGDCLSPTLFSVYINDLVHELKSSNLGIKIDENSLQALLYADDIVLIADNPIELQLMLDIVHKWCNTWKMKINMKKTKIIEFRKKGKERSIAKLKLGNLVVEYCSSYKYLGVTFDEFLTFDDNHEILTGAGHRALRSLIAKFKNLEDMGIETFTKCYTTSICPVTDYGAEIWGYTKYSSVDAVRLKAMRVFLGVHKFTALLFLEGELGWYPSDIRRKIAMLRYWNRLTKMNRTRLTHKLFEVECIKEGPWFKAVRKIFEDIDMAEICNLKTSCNITLCEEVLKKQYSDKWIDLIKSKPKLRTYANLKMNFETEKYVKLNLSRSQRSFAAQIRSGTLPLNIETGRFVGKAVEERICNQCQDNEIETEYHFLFYCPLYDAKRRDFLSHIDFGNAISDSSRLAFMFSQCPRKLAKFIVSIFAIRQNKLFNNT